MNNFAWYVRYVWFVFSFGMKVLLWQISVATDPRVFVIATWMWSEMIIYLLVSCNKQLFSSFACARIFRCLHTSNSQRERASGRCVGTRERSCASERWEKLLITTYQEVNDHLWSHTRCDDENVRIGGDTDLPEQHFSNQITMQLYMGSLVGQ